MKKNIIRYAAILIIIILGYMMATDAILRWFDCKYTYAFNIICLVCLYPPLVHLAVEGGVKK